MKYILNLHNVYVNFLSIEKKNHWPEWYICLKDETV